MHGIQYAEFTPSIWKDFIPKLSHARLLQALESAKSNFHSLERYLTKRPDGPLLCFRSTAYNWVSFSLEPPPCHDVKGERIPAPGIVKINFDDVSTRDLAHTLLNGKIGLLWWAIVGDSFHLTISNFKTIPFPLKKTPALAGKWSEDQRVALEAAMQVNLVYNLNAGKNIGNYELPKCRDISDKSDLIWKDALSLQDVWKEVDLAYAQFVKTDFGQCQTDNGSNG